MNHQPGPGGYSAGQQAGPGSYMPAQGSYSSAAGSAGFGQQMPPTGSMQSPSQYQQAPPQINYSQQQMTTSNMPPPSQQARPASQQNGSSSSAAKATQAALETISETHDGKTYKLEVVQEPIRARMCGFGDKDRRPITPPPCIRLVIIDDKTGKECDATEFEANFFVLNVDLWDESGTKEVNLVRHSATSPSISAATSSSYPPPTTPAFPYSANTAATANAHSVAAAHATGMQVHVGMTGPGYGSAQYGTHHAAPYMSQPPNTSPQGHASAQMAPYGSQDPHSASRGGEPQSYYVSSQGQPTGPVGYPGGYGPMPGYPGNMNMLSPQHAAPMDPRSAPSGMFTRNLIGSLSVNSNNLTDPNGKPGIWFILQDLSVRTEGVFRLKMQFCSVQDPANKETLNRGTLPILASTYSAPFQVYSAKKFPGVIESTPLSKCFAMQGVKIPIRKDGPTGKAAEVDDEAES